jgi:hypothetical protein
MFLQIFTTVLSIDSGWYRKMVLDDRRRTDRYGDPKTDRTLCILEIFNCSNYASIKRELRIKPMNEHLDRNDSTYLRNLHVSDTLGCSGDWNT